MLKILITAILSLQGTGLNPGRLEYDFFVSGEKKGVIIHEIDTITVNDTFLYRLFSLTVLEGDTVDSTAVFFLPDFTPVTSEKHIVSKDIGKIDLKVTYEDDKATIALETPDGSKEMDVKLEEVVYDNEEVPLIIPYLDFGGKDKIEIKDLSSFSGTLVKIKIERKGGEEIEVDGKKSTLNRYDLKFLGKRISIYYDPQDNHMVYYFDKTQKLEMKLRREKGTEKKGG